MPSFPFLILVLKGDNVHSRKFFLFDVAMAEILKTCPDCISKLQRLYMRSFKNGKPTNLGTEFCICPKCRILFKVDLIRIGARVRLLTENH